MLLKAQCVLTRRRWLVYPSRTEASCFWWRFRSRVSGQASNCGCCPPHGRKMCPLGSIFCKYATPTGFFLCIKNPTKMASDVLPPKHKLLTWWIFQQWQPVFEASFARWADCWPQDPQGVGARSQRHEGGQWAQPMCQTAWKARSRWRSLHKAHSQTPLPFPAHFKVGVLRDVWVWYISTKKEVLMSPFSTSSSNGSKSPFFEWFAVPVVAAVFCVVL